MAVTTAVMMAGASLYTSYSQSEALKMQGEFQRQQADFNARIAETQAEDAIRRGDIEASRYRTQVQRTAGAQRVGLAAQGIDIASGTAADIQEETQIIGQQDIMTIRNNAWREAWGYRMEAQNQRASGAMASRARQFEARNTLLTGGIQAANYGYQGYKDYRRGI